MSIRWDPLLTAAFARELSREVGGARVRSLLLDPEGRRVILFLREGTLAFELHPLSGRVSLLPAMEPFPDARPLPARIRSIEALPDESALVLDLRRVRGKEEGTELVVEWVGNRWNAVALGHRSRVIRHVLLPREERGRSLTVGAPYLPPPSNRRLGWDAPIDRDEWEAALQDAGDVPADRRRTLLRRIAWTSSLNVGDLTGPDGWERWRWRIDPQNWESHLIRTPRGLQPYPVALPGMESRSSPSLLEAIRSAREEEDGVPGAPEAALLPTGLIQSMEARIRRAERRLAGLERELSQAPDPAPIRAVGDLLLARLSAVPRGRAEAVLTGFDGAPVQVELDPALAPHENAARYYARAGRVERARAALPDRIEAARAEVSRWSSLMERARAGEVPSPDVIAALGPEGSGRTGPRGRAEPPVPYRRFTSSGGLEIRVGKGARHNDALTFHHAAPQDVWLHARQAAGAHVILRWQREDPPPRRDLVEAAILAALHSEARHSGSVPVDWTRRRYVRKPRKAAPGAVLPERVQTLFVEPDPELPSRLAPRSPGEGEGSATRT